MAGSSQSERANDWPCGDLKIGILASTTVGPNMRGHRKVGVRVCWRASKAESDVVRHSTWDGVRVNERNNRATDFRRSMLCCASLPSHAASMIQFQCLRDDNRSSADPMGWCAERRLKQPCRSRRGVQKGKVAQSTQVAPIDPTAVDEMAGLKER